MGRSQESYNKKEKEKKRIKKRKEKEAKRLERKESNVKGGSMDDMIAYVDENGQIVDTPPDPTKKEVIDAEDIELGIPKKAEIDLDAEMTGRVNFFNYDKGYGFIKELETQESYFVHVNGCIDEIGEGDKVTFELEKGLKGMNAVRVKKV